MVWETLNPRKHGGCPRDIYMKNNPEDYEINEKGIIRRKICLIQFIIVAGHLTKSILSIKK